MSTSEPEAEREATGVVATATATEQLQQQQQQQPVTTTISTIAVQSGGTRIVIALLQSKEWLQLKIQEMHPAMTEVGASVDEALQLQKQHEQVLEKLQTKQSPVEELLNQADELISNQKPRAEVYAAMAENLGLAWKDLNAQLQQRQQILDHAVAFHTRAREFSDRMDRAEKDFSETFLPSDTDSCKTILQRLQDAKKGILEGSMHTLNEGQGLLEKLREVAVHSMGDSRPAHMHYAAQQAIAFVERHMEELHDTRRHLESMWQKRKAMLEQCLQMCMLYDELNQVQKVLKSKNDELAKKTNLGDSSASAEILLHEHQKLEIEGKEQQDHTIHLVRTADHLANSGHYAGEEIKKRAYSVLEECSEFLSSAENRRNLLTLAVSFFNLAQTALNKLDQIEIHLTTCELPRASPQMAQLHAQMERTIDEVTSPALHEGYGLLEKAGPSSPGAQGVARKVSELENYRARLNGLCTAHRAENQERIAAFLKFNEYYNVLHTWIVSTGQAFLQGHQDMGSVLSMAKDFLDRHEKLLNEVRVKGMEVEALMNTLPSLLQYGGEEAEDAQRKANNLRNDWNSLRILLENRIRLAQAYLSFHKLAVQMATDMDSVDNILQNTQNVTESIIKQSEERWQSIQQLFLQLNNRARNFIEDAKKVDDMYLDTKRAILCVETLIDHFENRKKSQASMWSNWLAQVNAGKEQRQQWENFLKDANTTLDSVPIMESQLFPIIPVDMSRSDTIAQYLAHHMESILPHVKRLQSELEVRTKTAEMLTVSGEVQLQRERILEQLRNATQKLHQLLADYQILVSMMEAYFKNAFELGKLVDKEELQFRSAQLPRDLSRAEALLREHEAVKPAVSELFKFTTNEAEQVINKIMTTEPSNIAMKDREKVRHVLDMRKKQFENAWSEHKRHLEQHLQFCQFERDLQQINQQMDELNAQLEGIRGNYGESLTAARATSHSFIQFEKTIEILEKKIRTFVSTAEMMMKSQHKESNFIQAEVDNLQTKWSSLHLNVGENRKLIDLSISYFQLIEESEEWFQECSRVLITIARKSTNCRNPQEATNLRNEVDRFIKAGEVKQEERLRKISSLAVQLYGTRVPPSLDQVSSKQKEMISSFGVIKEELTTLSVSLERARQEKEKQMREKEEADATLKKTQAEATAAKAAALAAQEAAKAAEAAAKAIPQQPTVIEKVTVVKEAAPPPEPPKRPPVFVVPLIDEEVMEGTKFTFKCKVDGVPVPQVQWYKDGILIQNNPDYQTAQEDGVCTLTIEETFTEDSARFMCKAINSAGIAETYGRLTVKEARPHEELIPPHFLRELQPVVATEGESVVMECQVSGNPLPMVSWFKNDACIDSSPDYLITFNNGLCRLQIKEVTLAYDARYTCRAVNQAGQVACSSKLTVHVKTEAPVTIPAFLIPLSNVMARAGQKLRLECRVHGLPTPEITWLHNGKPIKEMRDIKSSYDGDRATLTINEAFPNDAGSYTVCARNQAGETTSTCNVSVKGRLPLETSDSELASDMEPVKPRVIQHLKDYTVTEGNRVRLDCVIVGQPEPEVIWYHDDKPVKESNDFQLLFEGDHCTLIIKEAYLEDAGLYKCVAINSGGEASSQCHLTVEPLSEFSDIERSEIRKEIYVSTERSIPPKFTKLLEDTTVTEGQRARLECRITGEPQPFVTWYKDGLQIESTSDHLITHDRTGLISLTFPEAFPEDAGNYSVKASNRAGDAKCFCTLVVIKKKVPPAVPSKPTANIPPKFQKYLDDLCIERGSVVKFVCKLTGQPKPEIQWCFNGQPVSGPEYVISSEGDTHMLTIPDCQLKYAGRYSITAENATGKATSSAILTVTEPSNALTMWDGIGEQRVHSSVMTKKMMSMHSSTITTTVVDSDSGYEYHEVSSKEQHSSLQVGQDEPKEYHDVQKTAIHKVDYGTSVPALAMSSTPIPVEHVAEVKTMQKPIAHKAPRFTKPVMSAIVQEGEKIVLEAEIEGQPEPSVRWFKNGIEIFNKPGQAITYINSKASLQITKASEKDAARYSCTATNVVGSATSTADVIVKRHLVAPKFLKPLQACIAKSGEEVRLEVEVTGVPIPDVKWYRNGSPIQNSPDFRIKAEGGGKHSLVIPEAFPDDSCKLMVKATNLAGEAQCTADLIVEEEATSPVEGAREHTVSSYKQISVVEQKKEQITKVVGFQSARPESIELPPATAELKPLQPVSPIKSPVAELEKHSPSPEPVAPVASKIRTAPKPQIAVPVSSVLDVTPTEMMNGHPVKHISTATITPIASPEPKQVRDISEPKYPKKSETPEIISSSYHSLVKSSPFLKSDVSLKSTKITTTQKSKEASTKSEPPKPQPEPAKPKPQVESKLTLVEEIKPIESIVKEEMTIKKETKISRVHSPRPVSPSPPTFQPSVIIKKDTKPGPESVPKAPTPIPRPEKSVPAVWKPGGEGTTTQSPSWKPVRVSTSTSDKPPSAAFSPVPPSPVRATSELSIDVESSFRPISPQAKQEMTTIKKEEVMEMKKSYSEQLLISVGEDIRGSPKPIIKKSDPLSPIIKDSAQLSPKPKKKVVIEEPPVVAAQVVPPTFVKPLYDITATERSQVTLECIVRGTPTPTIRWFRDDQPILPSSDHEIQFTKDGLCSLTIPEVYTEDAGKYSCSATNIAGSKMSTATLTVHAKVAL